MIYTDFSAVIDIIPQDSANCHVPAHVILDIFIVLLNPRFVETEGGVQKRVIDSELWYMISNQGNALKTNSFWHITALKHIGLYYTTSMKWLFLMLTIITLWTDGCAAQYKGRRNAWAIGWLLQTVFTTVEAIVHFFAATGTFKGMWDGAGFVFKKRLAQLETAEKARCHDGWQVFLVMSEQQKQPKPKADKDRVDSRLRQYTQIHYRYLVDISDPHYIKHEVEMRERQRTHGDVIFTDYQAEGWDATPFVGLNSSYGLRATVAKEDPERKPIIEIRKHPCSCAACQQLQTPCEFIPIVGEWEKVVCKYVPLPAVPAPPPTLQQLVLFFGAELASQDLVILAIARHPRRGGEWDDPERKFELGVMKKAVFRADRGGTWELKGYAANVVLKYDKGDYLAKVRMLEEIGDTLQFQCPRGSKDVLIMAKTIILPSNSGVVGVTRLNYLRLVTEITGPPSKRVHRHSISREMLESMNISAEYHVTCPDISLSDVGTVAATVSLTAMIPDDV